MVYFYSFFISKELAWSDQPIKMEYARCLPDHEWIMGKSGTEKTHWKRNWLVPKETTLHGTRVKPFHIAYQCTQTDEKNTPNRLTHQECDRNVKLSDQDEFLPVAEQWLGIPVERSLCLLRPRHTDKSEVEDKTYHKQVSMYTVKVTYQLLWCCAGLRTIEHNNLRVRPYARADFPLVPTLLPNGV